MNNALLYNKLDEAVEKILCGEALSEDEFDPIVADLFPIARDLHQVARPAFRSSLLARLDEPRQGEVVAIRPPVLPSLFATPFYPAQRNGFAASAALHIAALALLVTSSLWVWQHKAVVKQATASLLTDVPPYVLSPSPSHTGGGGGGGDRDRLAASRGDAPRFSREQITPPAIVVRNEAPKLVADPAVIGPPTITLSKLGTTGDPLSGVLGPVSNGTGIGGGIGTGEGGGVGSGYGAGVGSGYGGGIGGGIYRVGGGVSAPRAIYDPEPQYTDEARKAKYEGVVLLSLIVDPYGRPRDVRVARSLGMGLDEKAVEAVRQWKFAPAMKDGQPVAVLVNVEVNFRLY